MVEALAPDFELAEIQDHMDEIQETFYPEKKTSPFESKRWREMGRKMAHTYLKDNLKTLRYQPLIIDGKSYSLNALNGMTSWNIYQK